MRAIRVFCVGLALFSCWLVAKRGLADTFGSGINSFNVDFVTIGNPGNAPDTIGSTHPGSVASTYRIGMFEVSRDMINKANADGGLGIVMWDMASYGGNGPDRPA